MDAQKSINTIRDALFRAVFSELQEGSGHPKEGSDHCKEGSDHPKEDRIILRKDRIILRKDRSILRKDRIILGKDRIILREDFWSASVASGSLFAAMQRPSPPCLLGCGVPFTRQRAPLIRQRPPSLGNNPPHSAAARLHSSAGPLTSKRPSRTRGGDPTPTYSQWHSPRQEGSSVCVGWGLGVPTYRPWGLRPLLEDEIHLLSIH